MSDLPLSDLVLRAIVANAINNALRDGGSLASVPQQVVDGVAAAGLVLLPAREVPHHE